MTTPTHCHHKKKQQQCHTRKHGKRNLVVHWIVLVGTCRMAWCHDSGLLEDCLAIYYKTTITTCTLANTTSNNICKLTNQQTNDEQQMELPVWQIHYPCPCPCFGWQVDQLWPQFWMDCIWGNLQLFLNLVKAKLVGHLLLHLVWHVVEGLFQFGDDFEQTFFWLSALSFFFWSILAFCNSSWNAQELLYL